MPLPKSLWPVKRVVRSIFPAHVPQPEWSAILGEDYGRFRAMLAALPEDAPRVLLTPASGSPWVTTLDSLLAVALVLRGARPHVLVCDEVLPACQQGTLENMPNQQEFVRHGPRRAMCPSCHRPGDDMFTRLGIAVERLGAYLTPADHQQAERLARTMPLADIEHYTQDGLALGEHALAGAIRFFARANIQDEPNGEAVLRRYLQSALLVSRSVDNLFERQRFLLTSCHHGIYVPQGVVGEVARRRGVRVANWMLSYRKNTVIFSHGETYHRTLMTEPVAAWENIDWTPAREQELLDYLKSRWNGAGDWISFNRAPLEDLQQIKQQVGISFDKPTIGLLTNVLWDAQLHYPQNAFPNMLDWIFATIRHFAARPELQLLIRVHPAEVTGAIRSQQPVVAEIQKAFPTLPPNVFVIPPESKVSTYVAMLKCDSVLIYATKTGVELTSFGIPVVVAGEAWIRNKGITTDVPSPEGYDQLLARLPLGRRLDEEQIQRARKYAYHFFFRRMIPLKVIKQNPPGSFCGYDVDIRGLDDLRPGRDPGLDAICDGILQGTDFIYRAERMSNGASR